MNILSIDVDFFWKDCVFYQQHQDDELEPYQNWQLIKWKYKKPYQFDSLALWWIKKFLKERCKNVKKVYLIQEHDEIIPHMRRLGCVFDNVINIDNHHDISYEADDGDKKLTIENWVAHGMNENMIGEYTWIHQVFSQLPFDPTVKFSHYAWKDFPYQSEDVGEFDYIFICLSKYFTPMDNWEITLELFDYIMVECLGINESEYYSLMGYPVNILRDDMEEEMILDEDEINDKFDIVGRRIIYFDEYKLIKEYNFQERIYGSFCKTKDCNTTKNGNIVLKRVLDSIRYSILIERQEFVLCHEKGYKTEKFIYRVAKILEKEGYNVSVDETDKNKYYYITKN